MSKSCEMISLQVGPLGESRTGDSNLPVDISFADRTKDVASVTATNVAVKIIINDNSFPMV